MNAPHQHTQQLSVVALFEFAVLLILSAVAGEQNS
jgi:hypothetical protein